MFSVPMVLAVSVELLVHAEEIEPLYLPSENWLYYEPWSFVVELFNFVRVSYSVSLL